MGTRWVIAAILVVGLFIEPAVVRADVWIEVGDAGDLPGIAHTRAGGGDLSAIRGTLSGFEDADLFAVLITDPAAFSATTAAAGTTAFDTQLFLFDIGGFGVLANDDIVNGNGPYNPRSALPAGSLASWAAGIYYLAVSGWDRDPVSNGGQMFTDDQNYAGVVGAGGPGGAASIRTWDGDGALNGGVGDYTIALTGVAAVPEPASVLLLLTGLLLVVFR